jgi:hypothetical protein
LLRKEHKGLEKDIEDLSHERVLPVEGLIEPLYDQLADEKLHLIVVRILCQLAREEHLADTLDSDLTQDTILDYHIVL